MVTLNRNGWALDAVLPYKVNILIGREGKAAMQGKWKMHPTQVSFVAKLYGEPPVRYGGYEIEVDKKSPEDVLHFVAPDGAILAKVINLNTSPEMAIVAGQQ